MGAIGGIMEFGRYGVDNDALTDMRKAMALRARGGFSAFICGNAGMIYGGLPDGERDRQPFICERGGRAYALCIDGDRFDPSAILEKYLVNGAEFLGYMDGSFSLSVYDGERGMLLLARDKRGSKPLFYRISDGRVTFASEVKGLTAGDEYTEIDKEALSLHLTSPIGVYGAADIYTDINQVLPGQCVIFTRMGMSAFFYRQSRDGKRVKGEKASGGKENIISPHPIFNTLKISDYLGSALLAFDYPQFDYMMPSVTELLERSADAENGAVRFEDAIRKRNMSYACERQERLGSLYGVSAVGVISKNENIPYEAMCSFENALYERLTAMSSGKITFLSSILGQSRFDCLMRAFERKDKKAEDTELNIRILGMLCQTVEWAQVNRLLIKNGSLCLQNA